MYQFDWQGLSEGDFVKWMFVNLLTTPGNHSESKDLIDQLTEPTKKFTDVTLTMQVNGIEVNAENFIRSVEKGMNYRAEDAVKEAVSSITDIRELDEEISRAHNVLRDKLREIVKDKFGIDLVTDEWY